MLVQPDGRIVVVGYSHDKSGLNSRSILIRYTNEGNLDASFGDDGIVTTTIDDSSAAGAVVLQPDEKILVAGGSEHLIVVTGQEANASFPLVRYRGGNQVDFYLPIIRKEKNG